MRLHLKIIMLVTCISIGIGGFSAMVASRIMKTNMEIKLEQQTLTIAKVMCKHITHNVIAKEIIPAREALMDMVRRNDDIEFIYVTDFDRKVFAHSFEGDFPRALLENPYKPVSADKPLIRRYKTAETFLLDLAYPLIDGLDADIHVVMNEGYTFAYANSVRNRILELTLIVTVIGILLGIAMSHRITRPLADLADSMRAFGKEGVYSKLHPGGRGVEVDDLTNSFNSMIDDRKRSEEEILAKSEQLWASNQQLFASEQQLRASNQSLQQSEENFRGLVETSSDWIWEVIEGVYTYASPQVEEILGYKPEEVIGKSPFDLMSPEEKERLTEVFKHLTVSGKSIVSLENVNLHKDGRRIVLETSGVAVLDAAGKVTGYRGVDRDITDRKQAEEALKTAKEFSDNLVETANTLVVTLNSEAEITTFNRYAEKLTGYTKTEVIGRNWFDLFIPQRDKESIPKVFKDALNHISDASQYENPIVTKSGEERLMSWSNNVLRDNCGNINGILSIGMDITDQKRAEEEREELLRVLEAKNKELQSVVYIASHDLKSPLVNIQGFSSILDDSCKQVIKEISELELDDEATERILSLTREDIPESLRFISAGASKMKELLDGLLHVSHMGTVEINIRQLNVNDIVNNVCRFMEFQIKDAGVEVVIDDLPGCIGDAKMINQMFSNLIGNALKYLDPDRKGKIQISGKVENSRSIYCVEDYGIGIENAHQSKIFELFHRLNPDDSAGGEGLGLTIVTRILDRLNGHIRVESEPDKGSRFFVSLPTG